MTTNNNSFADFMALLKEGKQLFFSTPPNYLVGALVTIILFVIGIFWFTKHAGKKKQNKKVEKAEKMGHVVKGNRIKAWDDGEPGNTVNSWMHATYSYEVNGKKYKYRYMGKVNPPLQANIYWISSPRKAFVSFEHKSDPLILFVYLTLFWQALVFRFCYNNVGRFGVSSSESSFV